MHAGTNNRYLSVYISDWPHRCVITWDQCPPQACIATKGAPDKSYPHFSLRLVPYSKQACCCWLPQECKSIAFNFIRRYHTASTRTSWCYCKDHIHVAHSLFFCLLKNHPASFSLPRLDESCLLPSIYSIIDPIIDAKASFLAEVN